MKTEETINGAKDVPVKLQLVRNRLWLELSSEEQTQAFVTAAMREMQDGYQLAFPVMVASGCACNGVALVAKRDWRTDLILGSDEAPDATTHVAIFLLFRTQAEWMAETDKFIRLWPEQPEMPPSIIGAGGHGLSFPLVDDEGSRV